MCGRNLLKQGLGLNDLEVVEGCDNVAEKLKSTVPTEELGFDSNVAPLQFC